MARAIWNDAVIVDTDDTVVVEGNHYFPLDAVAPGVLEASDHTSVCPWKGTAHYFSVTAGGATAQNAAWTYPDPSAAAAEIAGRVAFWGAVTVEA